MTLREKAESHLAIIIENKTTGFGWDVQVTDPSGFSVPMVATSSDIHQILDPETGLAMSGRQASVNLRMSTLEDLGFTTLPRNVQENTSKPWTVEFLDLSGVPQLFKVNQGNPDRTLGLITCFLEVYSNA